MPAGDRDRATAALEAIVRAVCPPQVLQLGVAPVIAADARSLLHASPPAIRSLLLGALVVRHSRVPLPPQVTRALQDLVVTVAYERPEVHTALGYDPAAWVARTSALRLERWGNAIREHADAILQPDPLVGSGSPRRPGRFVSATALQGTHLDCDVVIVGSGAGGAVVAAELAEAGLRVTVLEEGPHIPTEGFTTDALTSFRTLYRDAGATAMLGRPPVTYSEGRCVGGSTTVNGGMAWRTPEVVLERWRRMHGLGSLTTERLVPLFDRVERRLSVSLQDPGSIGRDQELFRLGAERLGWQVVDNRRAQVHCGGCNTCILGCPSGAKQSTLVSYLPRAVAFGATVVSNCRVDAITLAGCRATGVRAIAADGRRLRVRAPVVVSAAGAIQTPALLLRSGVRSRSGQLGRNLAIHPGAHVIAAFDERVDGWRGVHQAYQVREFAAAGVLMASVNLPPGLVARSLPLTGQALGTVMSAYDRIVTAGVLVEDSGTGRVRCVGGRVVPSYTLAPQDARRIVDALVRLCELLFAAGARQVFLPVRGTGRIASAAEVRHVLAGRIRPSQLAVTTVHLMGTARMGGDATSSVCDPTGRVHGTDGLYVADASLLPSPPGLNPMETIMVLATLVAQGIIDAGTQPA